MRYFLLLLALLLAAVPAVAQISPIAARPDSLVAAQAAPDTAAAIHRLFAARRRRQVTVGVATMGVAIGALAIVSASNQQTSKSRGSGASFLSGPIFDEQVFAALAVGAITVPVMLGELVLFGGWSKKKEQRVIEDWEQHSLARFFKRRLKPKYFVVPPPRVTRKAT